MTDNAETLVPVKFEQKLDLQLNELRLADQFCDVRFEINGKMFPCHRVVLVAVSSYFQTMFNGNFKESSSNVIVLKEIEAETFENILNAIYTANIRLVPNNVYFILKASHLFLLKAVVKACESYIMENCSSVHYLVEICSFSDNVELNELYQTSVTTISQDLITYAQTDSFTQISVEIFKSILEEWSPKSYEEEFTVLLILKWCKENGAGQEAFQRLLKSSQLQTLNYINPRLMAGAFITLSDGIFVEMKNQISTSMDLDIHSDLNLYLHIVDVKTAEKGWGVLKVDDKFDTCTLSSFHPSHSSYKSVCKVGSKMYCFEYFADEKRNVFSSHDENNDKILLPVPDELAEFYQIASMETSIYLMIKTNNRLIVWVYECNLKSWKKLLKETDGGEYDSVYGYTFSNGYFYIIAKKSKRLCIDSLISIDSRSLAVKYLINWACDFETENAMLCGFDHKLAVYDRTNPWFDFFDLESEEWLNEEFETDFKREKFCVIHHNGFLYAVGNNRILFNQKYSLKTNTSEQLSVVPKRITLCSANNVRVFGTGDVFGVDSEPANDFNRHR